MIPETETEATNEQTRQIIFRYVMLVKKELFSTSGIIPEERHHELLQEAIEEIQGEEQG